MARKKILILTFEYPPFPGGIARYTAELAKAAAEAGHEVHVVAPDYEDPPSSSEKAEGNVQVHRYGPGTYSAKRLPAMTAKVLSYLRKEKWDIVHAADSPYATVLAFIARFKNVRFTATVHGSDILNVRGSKSIKLLCKGNPYAASEKILCNSHFTRELLHQHLPSLPRGKSLVTHLGVNPFWLEESNEVQVDDLRRRLGIAATQRIILTVSRLDRRKGHLAVLKSLGRCWEAGIRNFHYLIVGGAGEKSYEHELKDEVKKVPFPVTLAGVLGEKELRTLYRNSAIFCMPGTPVPDRVEGFGLAYLEAAACGLPCIGTKIGGVGEVIKDQETGFLLPDPDPALLSDALSCLLTDEVRRLRMAHAARLWAQTFTWSRCAALSYDQGAKQTLVADSIPLADLRR